MKKIAALVIVILMSLFFVNAVNEENTNVYKKMDTEKKIIALTFDDGPHPKQTPAILDILKKYNIKATFFVVGENAEYYPETMKRLCEEGHEIGNHTFSHVDIRKTKRNSLIDDIQKNHDIIKKYNNSEPTLLRPPGGVLNTDIKDIANSFGYNIILWNIDTRDWSHESVDSIENNILKNIENGSIILFHDYILNPTPTPEAINKIIPELQKEGYTFVTVSELINSNK